MTQELQHDAGSAVINPGELLRAERERVGFTTDEVAAHLHLSRTTLGYLEAGRFDRLPGDTFARGYVRSYARLLKLDPKTLAQHYDRYVGVEGREARVSSISRIEGVPRRGARWTMLLSTLLIVAVMLALGLWWWSVSRDPGLPPKGSDVSALIDDVQVDSVSLPENFISLSAEPPAAAEGDAEPVADNELTAGLPQGLADEIIATPQEGAPEAVSEVSEVAPAEVETVTPQAVSGLVITFRDNCWVQVSTPGGRVLHSGQMNEGQSLTIAEQGPLDLVIGAADAVSTIEFNGQPVELSANRQSGVARLRVGQ